MLPAGGWRTFTLVPGESEIDLYTASVTGAASITNALSGIYYAPGEPVPDIGTLGNTVGRSITSGSVSITGTPNVTISGTPSVSISGTPSVNIANSPNVNIANTPSVSISGTPSVSISGTPTISVGSGTINVSNMLNPFSNSSLANMVSNTTTVVPAFFNASIILTPPANKLMYVLGVFLTSATLTSGADIFSCTLQNLQGSTVGTSLSLAFTPYANTTQGAQFQLMFGTGGYPCYQASTSIIWAVTRYPTNLQTSYTLSMFGYYI